MKVTQKRSAAVLAGLMACTWAVPAAVSHAVPEPRDTVGAHETRSLESPTGTAVAFEAPRGWTATPPDTRTSATFTGPRGGQELVLSVVDGSQDFDTTAQRVLRHQALNGVSAAFDGGTVAPRNGFTGRTCVAVKTEEGATGPCAVVHHGETVVLVTATSTDRREIPELEGVLDSLRKSEEGAR